jgi:hypothetical protein
MLELVSVGSGPDPDFHRLFEKLLTELGRSRLLKAEAGRIIAQEYAEEVCNGTVTPIDGARAIWRVALECEELHGSWGFSVGG